MPIQKYEALAFLRSIKNVRKGLLTRSKIIRLLKTRAATTKELAGNVKLSYSTVRRHLKMMEKEGIVIKVYRKWKLTGKGQQDLLKYLTKKPAY
ncbi:MAG: winged helix-turn-helix domain-containing protein [archaeon GB-1867-005]|nr:winged helix-turn-helix domain-containing protein [Candidatus Culexmicrobium cathedralense]